MKRTTAPLLLITTLALSACGGRFSDSGLNPLGWFGGGSNAPTTLEPKEGYGSNADARQGITQITGARWELLNEGRLLIVTGITPTKGYWAAELIPEVPEPTGRLIPDPDGVLRLRFVIWPPPAESTAARMPANPQVDTITTAITISNVALARITEVVVSGAGNSITISK